MTKFALSRNYNALLIEANAYHAHLMESLLRQCGIFSVFTISNGDQVIPALVQQPFDIVLCDLDVKPQGGLALLKLIRDRNANPHYRVPVIMTCGAARIEDVISARDSGMSEFLSRPVSPKALYLKLHSALEKDRPFIEIDGYVGPDRRRRDKDSGCERRGLPDQAAE